MTVMRNLASVMILGVALHATDGPVTTAPSTSLAAQVERLADSLFDTQLLPGDGRRAGPAGGEHGRITDNPSTACARRGSWMRCAQARAIDRPAHGPSQEVTCAVLHKRSSGRALRACRAELWGVASYVNVWQAQYWISRSFSRWDRNFAGRRWRARTRALRIGREDFFDLLGQRPALSRQLLGALFSELSERRPPRTGLTSR
jgi:hypothetical protein